MDQSVSCQLTFVSLQSFKAETRKSDAHGHVWVPQWHFCKNMGMVSGNDGKKCGCQNQILLVGHGKTKSKEKEHRGVKRKSCKRLQGTEPASSSISFTYCQSFSRQVFRMKGTILIISVWQTEIPCVPTETVRVMLSSYQTMPRYECMHNEDCLNPCICSSVSVETPKGKMLDLFMTWGVTTWTKCPILRSYTSFLSMAFFSSLHYNETYQITL